MLVLDSYFKFLERTICLMIKLKKKGYVCGNVPLEFKNRESGRSNVKVGTIAEFLKNLLSFRFSDYYGK